MIIAPSVLAVDYARMKEMTEELNASKAEWLHFDVMDGHFVPNLTFGPDILKGYRKLSPLVMDVHLMVSDPAFISSIFIKAGADHITFHEESFPCLRVRKLLQVALATGGYDNVTCLLLDLEGEETHE